MKENTLPHCPICDSKRCDIIWRKDGYDVWYCHECAHRFIWPLPTAEQLRAAYQEHYSSLFLPPGKAHRCAVKALVDILSRLPVGKRYFEIGPGYGAMIQYARKSGYEVFAQEFTSSFAKVLTEKAIVEKEHLFIGDLTEMPTPAEPFDVVVMRSVIEHLVSPRVYLQEIHKLLSPRGVFLLQGERYDCFDMRDLKAHWAHVMPPFHLHYFTKNGITETLRQCGFRVVRFDVAGMPRYSPPFRWPILDKNPLARLIGDAFFDQSPVFYAYAVRQDGELDLRGCKILSSRLQRWKRVMVHALKMDC